MTRDGEISRIFELKDHIVLNQNTTIKGHGHDLMVL